MDSQNTLPVNKLLVAEDNESNFLLVMTILKRDYQIIHALDGLEAIQKYRQYSPDAILMDLKMPNMDGLEATREIRKLNTCIPIIVVSAFAFDSDKQEASAAGCTDYLTKPIDARLLNSKEIPFLKRKQNSHEIDLFFDIRITKINELQYRIISTLETIYIIPS